MVFSSLTFVFLFLPIVAILYYLAKAEYRNNILLLSSLIFYSAGEPVYLVLLLFSIVFNYYTALYVERQRSLKRNNVSRVLLICDIVINLSILFVFKYLGWLIGIGNNMLNNWLHFVDIQLPLGISFFTFQAMSYVIDVYRKEVKAQKNVFYVALFISFFPQLIAGPIVRYKTIEEQISHRELSLEKFSEGVLRFVRGFSKKILLANNLSEVVGMSFGNEIIPDNGVILWISSICFSLQIYYDFSGYSDMAIGLGEMFGFELPENFNYPYNASNVTDFWRRWHISLSAWFRDYLYIPLGGNQVCPIRHIINLFVVWLFTGIWHGANFTFIIWGLLYFIILVLEKYVIKPDKTTNPLFRGGWRIISLLFVNLLWVVFNSPTIHFAGIYCGRMLGIVHDVRVAWNIDSRVTFIILQYGFFILCALILATPAVTILEEIAKRKMKKWRGYTRVICSVGYLFIFLWSLTYIILGAHNPFLYFNF